MRSFKIIISVFLYFLILVAVSCSDGTSIQESDETGGTLKGTVMDRNGAGVPHAIIRVQGLESTFTVTANASGVFSISLFKGGSYVLTPVLQGALFEPVSKTVQLSGVDITNIDFTLESSQLTFSPAAATVSTVGETSTVDVDVNYIRGLVSAQLSFTFDPAIVEVTAVTTSGDGFFFTDAGVFVVELTKDIDNQEGIVTIRIGGLTDMFTGVSGNGKLLGVTFEGKKTGTSSLTFVDANPGDIILAEYVTGNGASVEPGVYFKTNGAITVK